MKKLLIVLLIALALFVVGVYVFIPSSINISSVTTVKTTDNGTERFLMDESKWPIWWNSSDSIAANKTATSQTLIMNGDEYALKEKFYKAVSIQIKHQGYELTSKMVIVRLTLDSTGIEWKANFAAGNNPLNRFSAYLEARKIKKNMDEVLSNAKRFLSKDENLYGISIERNFLKDTLYVTAKTELPAYPSTQSIYELIKKIQGFITKNGASQTGSPIFNVTDFGSGRFQLMAGVPTDKNFSEKEGFSLKHMVRGSFMISEVVGGDYAVNKASKSLQQYFSDFHRTSMAMSFTMLVTNRILQPDSSKWITKLYQPVY